ncbi:glycine betaine ABC transporter substrate-binding protein [Candidatus Parabeggiatoa sp. HSG14]|uniref:glycine betaine ABC transporter substrate-binding protein n=1 Tax=Candidatus Parabeggiatoa sp. HSG14 TaxID=3055593 RepID=UPI0025A8E00A|nr:glycine betaine ABC transporter substrate-binding protein [Thiotrichales bacterium HSG14]
MKNYIKVFLSIFAFLILAIFSWLFYDRPNHTTDATKGAVELVYVEWSSEIASTNVIRVVLEELGYEVDILSVSAAAMWQSVASGDADGHVAAWLPSTHTHYFNAVKDRVENLGANLMGTKIGLVVPQYVTINTIDELKVYAHKFQNRIIGIDPGAGLMSKTETAMEEYNLNKFQLIQGSGATMTAVLAESIKNQQWVVVTGWTPHWKFARWKLKYLKDSKQLYGEEEYIGTIVRKGLKEDMPEVYRVLDNFFWTPAEMGQIMIWNQQPDTTPYQNAKRWVKENRDKVKWWISQ